MKFIFALLVVTPLVYCATLTHEEQLVIQAMTPEQKRTLDFKNLPTIQSVKEATCKVLSSEYMLTCPEACQIALTTIPYGSFAGTFCDPVCNTVHC